jgi:hypothetical protein
MLGIGLILTKICLPLSSGMKGMCHHTCPAKEKYISQKKKKKKKNSCQDVPLNYGGYWKCKLKYIR